MKFHGNNVISTSVNVWRAIRESNKKDLLVFSSYTTETRAETCYGLTGADYPIMCAVSSWRLDENIVYRRINEEHKYYLVVAEKDKDE